MTSLAPARTSSRLPGSGRCPGIAGRSSRRRAFAAGAVGGRAAPAGVVLGRGVDGGACFLAYVGGMWLGRWSPARVSRCRPPSPGASRRRGSASSSPARRSCRRGAGSRWCARARGARAGRGRTSSTSEPPWTGDRRAARTPESWRRPRASVLPLTPWSAHSRRRSARRWTPGWRGCRGGSRPRTAGGSLRAAAASARPCCRRPVSGPTCRTASSTGCRRGSRRSSTAPSPSTPRSTCPCCRPSSTSRPRATGRAAIGRPRTSTPSTRVCRWIPTRSRGAVPLHDLGHGGRVRCRRPRASSAQRRGEGGAAPGGGPRRRLREHGRPRGVHDPAAPPAADPGRDHRVRRAADRGDARRAHPLARRAVRSARPAAG